MNSVNKYRVELDACKHPVLVLEETLKYNMKPIDVPRDAVNMLNSIFRLNKLAEEKVVMIAINTKGKILGLFVVSHGTVNTCCCNPREVFLRALMVGATGILVVHNHPSGICDPSDTDRRVAKRMKAAGEIIGIDMLDFITVGDADYYSFQEEKIL